MAEKPERNFVFVLTTRKGPALIFHPSFARTESTLLVLVSELFVSAWVIRGSGSGPTYARRVLLLFPHQTVNKAPDFLNGRQVLRVFGPQTATELERL
jgi:hypothetical protein